MKTNDYSGGTSQTGHAEREFEQWSNDVLNIPDNEEVFAHRESFISGYEIGSAKLLATCLNHERTNQEQAVMLNAVISQRDGLLAALEDVKSDLLQRAEMDGEDGGAILNISNGVFQKMNAAIVRAAAEIGAAK